MSARRANDVDTLGGYLVTQIGRVPVRGELVPGPGGFEIEVLDADPRRVKKVKIHRGKDAHDRDREPRDQRRRIAAAARARGDAVHQPALPMRRRRLHRTTTRRRKPRAQP